MVLIQLLAILIFICPSRAQNSPLDVGSNRQLFIDYKFIEQSDNVTLQANRPRLIGPVIKCEHPWEAGGLGWQTVADDMGQFKMWYTDWAPHEKRFMYYAVSTDGINWEKPRLGLVESGNSRDNNILPVEMSGAASVLIDPMAPPHSRYKMLVVRNWGKKDAGIYIYEAPDGISFTLNQTRLLDLWPDTQNQVVYDTRIKKYAAYLRSWRKRSELPYGKGGPLPHRTVSRIEIENLLSPWPYQRIDHPYELWGDINIPAITNQMQEIMGCDEMDPPETDLYNPCVVQYQWASDAYFAFPSLYRHFPPPPEGKYSNDGIVDIQLSVSRDGISWKRYRAPYLGFEGDVKCLFMGIGMLRIGNEIYQYFLSTRQTHGENVDPNPSLDLTSINCVVQRLDGYISADAAYTGGFIITPPITFAGSSLELNINTSALGHALVEILDPSGKPVEGFSLADSDPIEGNYINKTVSWKGNTDVGALAGREVKLHIVMRAAKLYAFQFK